MNEVKYFKDLGLEFVEGDTTTDGNPFACDGAALANGGRFNNLVIGEFAWRTNTGKKPSYTGDKVEVEFRDGAMMNGDIIKWRPILQSSKNAIEEVVSTVIESDEYTHGQDVYLTNGDRGHNWKFAGYTLNRESCSLINENPNSLKIVAITDITSTPPKSEEELLREDLIGLFAAEMSMVSDDAIDAIFENFNITRKD